MKKDKLLLISFFSRQYLLKRAGSWPWGFIIDAYYESDEFKHRSETNGLNVFFSWRDFFSVAAFSKVECACVCSFKINQCLNLIDAYGCVLYVVSWHSILNVTILILVISSRKFGSSGKIPWNMLSLKGQKFVIYSAMLAPPVYKVFIRKKSLYIEKKKPQVCSKACAFSLGNCSTIHCTV